MNDLKKVAARALGAGFAVSFVCLLVWQAHDAGKAHSVAAQKNLMAVDWPSANVAWGQMFAQRETPRPATQAAPAPVTAVMVNDTVPAPSVAGGVEVCGIGRVKADASGDLADPDVLKVPADKARARLLAALAASSSETARAAGWLLRGAGSVPVADGVSAKTDGAQPGAATAVVDAGTGSPGKAAREALVNMAITTQSPQVYAMALQACNRRHDEGSCRLVSSDQWARLEPANLIPWLQVAYDAKQRGDAAAVDEAHYRMSHATKNESRWNQLTNVVMANMPNDVAPAVKLQLVMEAIGMDAVMPIPGYQVTTQYCAAAQVRDANRQQVCSGLADVMVKQGTSLLDMSLGTVIGERAGWPAERVAALRDERDAMQYMLGKKNLPEAKNLWACDSVNQMTRYFTDLSLYGEVGSLRRALKQPGELSVAELARQHREAYAKHAAAFAAAASAASAVTASVATIQ